MKCRPKYLHSRMICVSVIVLYAVAPAIAAPITVDEILFAGDTNNGSLLTGTVDMSLSGSMLTVVLENTSASVAVDGNGAFNLLTGLAFNLPAGVVIGSGSATVPGGAGNINFSSAATNVGSEWGHFSGTPSQGHWNSDGPALLTYNAILSSMTTDSVGQGGAEFDSGAPDLGNPNGFNGPDFGALSTALAASVAGGQEAIHAPITFVLNLTGAIPGDLLAQIEAGPVGISFSSPGFSNLELNSQENPVAPEPSSLALLVLGSAGLIGYRRRIRG